jgi:hypothetical protein
MGRIVALTEWHEQKLKFHLAWGKEIYHEGREGLELLDCQQHLTEMSEVLAQYPAS